MHTTTLFTFIAAFFFAFLSCTSALPASFEAELPTPGPRSLLGRTYLRHAAVTHSNALPRAVPATGEPFIGRAERFQAIQRRHVAHPDPEPRRKAISSPAPQLHAYPAEESQATA